MNSDEMMQALMAEMGAAQGYDTTKAAKKNSPKSVISRGRKRLLSELAQYPDNNHRAGSDCVWNALVQGTAIPTSFPIPFLATNPTVEVIRRRAYEKFKANYVEMLERIQTSLAVTLQIPSLLEKWHMDSKFEETRLYLEINKDENQPQKPPRLLDTTENIYSAFLNATNAFATDKKKAVLIDPILVSKSRLCAFSVAFKEDYKRALKVKDKKMSDQELQKIISSPKTKRKVKSIEKAMHAIKCKAHEYMEAELKKASAQITTSSKLPKIVHDVERDQKKVIYAGLTFAVHVQHFEKLQRMFDRSITAPEPYTFSEALFCLLCRYDMLQGAGLQAGLPGSVFDTLLIHFECQMECFASPLNCRYQNFGSAFDLDRLFGSKGSFFTHNFEKGGCFQANPPFCERVINGMCLHMDHLLTDHTATSPLMFIIFVPVWKESEGYQQLHKSDFLARHEVLEQGHHWYSEGTQYRRKSSFRVASFDTSIFFYQNDAAKQKWPVTDAIMEELVGAFQNDPRRAESKRGGREKKINETKREKVETKLVSPPGSEHNHNTVSVNANEKRVETNDSNETKRSDRKPQKGGGKKRKLLDSDAQLDLLSSLGLSNESTTNKPKGPGKTVLIKTSKSKKKR